MFPPPDPDSPEGAHAAEAARALLPLLEEMRPHAVVSDILTLAPALAAEVAGVPRATLIPHIYPVVEPGLPFFAVGLQPPRTPLGRRRLASGAAGAERRPGAGARRPQPAAGAAGPAPHRALPRRDQPRSGAGRHLPAARVPAALAGRGRGDGADELRGPPSRRSSCRRARTRSSWSRRAPRTTPRNHLVRTALEALAAEPVRVVATTNRVVPQNPIEVPGQRDPRRLAQLQPADAGCLAGDLARRPRHRSPRARAPARRC